MLTEIACLYGIKKAYDYMQTAEIRQIKRTFTDTVLMCNCKNKKEETYKIIKWIQKDYGYNLTISIPNGLDSEILISHKTRLENSLKGIVEFTEIPFSNLIKMKLINKDYKVSKFEPVKTKPYQLLLGYNVDGTPMIIDVTIDPHLLIAGATGTGKSFLLAMMLTNLIYNSPKDIDIYLLQIIKGEIDIFKNCKPVRYTAGNTMESAIILEKLSEMVHRRSKEFTACGVKNIKQFNKRYPNKKKKYVYVVMEEISFFMPSGEEDDLRARCWDNILLIAKAGRSSGIYLTTVTQRSTAANVPTELKAQMSRITGRQKSSIDSTNVINTTDATKLGLGEFILDGNNTYTKFKTPLVDEDFEDLRKYVPELITPSNVVIKPKKVASKKIVQGEVAWSKVITREEYEKEKRENTIIIEEIPQTEDTKKDKKKRDIKGIIAIPQEVLNNVNGKG